MLSSVRPAARSARPTGSADFAAELRRKRGGRSFRELFEQYPDAVLALTPCVLVSPASAANFLAPGSQRFDLVIFDEASQIRVAEAIGAMGRGGAVVVVGDSRQMPPSSIMQASHTVDDVDEGDGPVLEDLESILSEAVESGLPQRWLSWHYRSHDESLIAFSNRYYYDNKLSSLPSPGMSSSAGDDHLIVCAPNAVHDWVDLVHHNTYAHECVRLDFAGPDNWSGDWPLGDASRWAPNREDVPSWFEPGDNLISWGYTGNGDFLFWHVRPAMAPEDWPVVLKERGPYWEHYHVGFSAALVGLLTGEIQSEYLSRWLGGPHAYGL